VDAADFLPQIAVALALAFAGGYLARLVGIPTVVGYLLAGVAISPFTPGFDGDLETLREVAQIGVVFLMFGIGLSFDLPDVLAVRRTAVPGALFMGVLITAAGVGVAGLFGLSWEQGFVIGVAMAVSSSAVISRTVLDRGLTDSIAGRVAIGWTIVEDLATVFILAVLPSLAISGDGSFWEDAGVSLLKAGAFVAVMLVAGRFIIPVLLRRVALQGSRELFILCVVALALGIATGGAYVFDVSVAIGAFIAGVAVSETDMGHQATADVLPLREAFAVLFFVSVGMLVDPRALVDSADLLLAILAIAVGGKVLIALLLFAFFPFSGRIAFIVAAGIAQFGEFSFLVAEQALDLGIIEPRVYNVLLGASVASIALNPLLLMLGPAAERLLRGRAGPVWRFLDRQGELPEHPVPGQGHVVILGYGRVGELTGHALRTVDIPFVVVEEDLERARQLVRGGHAVVWGDAASGDILAQAGVTGARLVVVALPDENSTLLAVQHVRRVAPGVPVVVRARVREEVALLVALGIEEVVVPEYEGGLELMSRALVYLGYPEEEAEAFRMAVRDITYDLEPFN
jgi:CPA2 family monovalent cation:H+ antiporter-2